MARVPTLDNQTRGLSPLQPARTQFVPNTGLQSLGAALGDVNQVAQQIRQQEQLKADQAAFMEADRVLGENENAILNDPTSGAFNYRGKDAMDITSKALEEFDAAASKAQQGLTTERQRRVFAESLQQRRQGVERQLMRHESAQREAFYASEREAYKQSAQSAAITNFRDPERIEQEIEKARSAIDQTPGLSAEQRAAELSQRRSAVYGGVIDRFLANDEVDPAEAYYTSVKDRVDGETATNIERALRVAKDRQEAKKESGLSLARAELQDQVRDVEAAFRQGIPVAQIPPESRFVSLYGDRGRKMYEQTKLMADASVDAATLTQRSTADVARIAAGYVPTEVRGSAVRAEVASIIQQQAQRDLKERENDPAGYLVRHSPSVRATWEDFANGGDVSRYVTAVRGEQERLGLPAGDILPDAYASEMAARISQADPEGMAGVIQSEASRWGNAWPQVYGQLVAKNISPAAVAIGRGMDPAASIRLANAAATPLEELKKGVDTPPSDVRAEIDANMRDFMHTLDGVVGGDHTFASMHAAVELLTYSYLRQGESVEKAAEQAYNEVLGDHYSFREVNGRSFRVPIEHDMPGLEIGARRALNTVQSDQLQVPIPTGQATVLDAVYEQYPVLEKYGFQFKDSPADPRGRKLEFYPPGERDSTFKDKSRPGIERFDPSMGPADIFGEMLHYAPEVDSKVGELRERFQETISTAQQERWLRGDYEIQLRSGLFGREHTFDEWLKRQGGDAFFRGYLTKQYPAEAYTQEQKALFDDLNRYLRSGLSSRSESAATDLKRAIQRRGYWVTSADQERGLALFLDGAPVLRKDGSIYEVTWDDLAQDIATTRSAIEQDETDRLMREAQGLR